MKKIFIVIPSLLMLSGCITSMEAEIEYRKQCKQLKEPYINQELFNKFLNEKNINVSDSKSLDCASNLVCGLMIKRDRWDNIKITKSKTESVIYYKDYFLKNCTKVDFGPIIYKKDNRKFCIGEKFDDNTIDFTIRYESDSDYIYKKKSRYVKIKYDRLYYNNELVLSREAIIYQAPTAHDTCNSNENIYEKFLNNI